MTCVVAITEVFLLPGDSRKKPLSILICFDVVSIVSCKFVILGMSMCLRTQ